MSEQLAIAATVRSDLGKGASRRLRRSVDHIPAIIYGAGKDPAPLTIVRKDLEKALENEAFYSQVIDVSVDGDVQPAILKDLQRHPARNDVMHADFLRVDAKVAIKVNIPLHFINEEKCHGVKIEGGIIEHLLTELEVLCLPGLIPEYIEVDMENVTTADIIHISDLKLPEGVVSTALELGEDHDMAVTSVSAKRGGDEEVDEDAPEASAEEGESEGSDDED
ncbi:50S ribosomal protein L25/general stress protein Ctc [Congregibacter litoralis]|uniref:Large ribosomal subunit protein bL25 n=1 Tax=Congregibacter litoralis KT71 TaxID=314285 RepID=A4A593_9GAMM|nr:50S ribosomal protein L25/general stress protein Ctc [Congregibacter litoralis]EAQ98964.1 LSU ribosomal protein L25P [Congregibacter litoralis KT71]